VELLDEMDPASGTPPTPTEARARDAHQADEYECRARSEMNSLFRKLKYDAQEIYGLVTGAPSARTPEQWRRLLDKAGEDIGSGRFIVRCLGAERYLDPEMVAVLVALRQNLIAELKRPTTADLMKIDAAIVSYFNMIRAQKWIGNLSIVVERELFGQEPLSEIHGPIVGGSLEEKLRRLAEVIMPLQDRASRSMMRALGELKCRPTPPPRRRSKTMR
jgi:hypothetical protein